MLPASLFHPANNKKFNTNLDYLFFQRISLKVTTYTNNYNSCMTKHNLPYNFTFVIYVSYSNISSGSAMLTKLITIFRDSNIFHFIEISTNGQFHTYCINAIGIIHQYEKG